MRNTFFNAVCDAMEQNTDVEFLKADVSFNARILKEHSDKHLNVGISEQNMLSIAAGMALEGKIVFAYSLTVFPTIRALDQIRYNVGYYNANVKVVACGAGFDYVNDGLSHVAVEDIAALRAIPNLTIFSPCDPYETEAVTKTAVSMDGPCFLRIGRGGEPNLHKAPIVAYIPGQVLPLREGGSDVTFLVTGAIANAVITVANKLAEDGYDVGVYSFPTIRPLNAEFLEKTANLTRLLVTVEEHNLNGGFGSAVAEVLAEMSNRRAMFKRIGVPDGFQNSTQLHDEQELRQLFKPIRPEQFMRKQLGLDAGGIERTVRIELEKVKE